MTIRQSQTTTSAQPIKSIGGSMSNIDLRQGDCLELNGSEYGG